MATTGLNVSQIKQYVIRPTLAQFPAKWDSEAAVVLLTGTMLVESTGVYIEQLGGGPAIGVCQMEPATHDDCYNTFLNDAANLELLLAVKSFLATGPGEALDQMHGNLFYAFAMARVKYIRARPALPAATDAVALAEYHKANYNSSLGATVVAASTALFRQAIAA